ncbi:hypothetical protein [Mesorhizobium caraganae]|nr:hypothetical protein [Mesorhizobium caraganae]
MDNVVPFRKALPCIEVVEACGEWFVTPCHRVLRRPMSMVQGCTL